MERKFSDKTCLCSNSLNLDTFQDLFWVFLGGEGGREEVVI